MKAAAPAVAGRIVGYARNSDKVDGHHAVVASGISGGDLLRGVLCRGHYPFARAAERSSPVQEGRPPPPMKSTP